MQNDDNLYTNSKKNFRPNKYEDFGYFFFPERFGNIVQPKWYDDLFSFAKSGAQLKKLQCEQNVLSCIEKHPGVKLLLSAMKKVGCKVDILRHFSCETCDSAVKGGFDPSTNQIVVCSNTTSSLSTDEFAKNLIKSLIQSYDYCRASYNMFDHKHLACSQIVLCHNNVSGYKDCAEILSHELIHAFDFCRANIDLNNNYHVACSEIRAANLTSCTIFEAIKNDSAFFTIKNAHKECVRRKAALSLQMVRNLTEQEAFKIIDLVFDKCYNDLEPFGRRITSESDCKRAYEDRRKFGYE